MRRAVRKKGRSLLPAFRLSEAGRHGPRANGPPGRRHTMWSIVDRFHFLYTQSTPRSIGPRPKHVKFSSIVTLSSIHSPTPQRTHRGAAASESKKAGERQLLLLSFWCSARRTTRHRKGQAVRRSVYVHMRGRIDRPNQCVDRFDRSIECGATGGQTRGPLRTGPSIPHNTHDDPYACP